MGQSKKVECAVPILRTLAGIRFPECSQRRLRGMNAQAKAGKPLRQYVHDLASVCFDFAPDDESSSARESHPRALSDPDVNLSAHPAPIVQPQAVPPSANAQRG